MTKRDRIVLAVILGAALLAAFWFMAVAPKRKTTADLDKQIAAQQQRLDAAQAKAGAAEAAKRRYRADYAAVAELGQAVPADDDVPSLVYQLDQAAKKQQIDFRALSISSADGNSGKSASTPAPAAPAQAQGAAAAGSGASTGTDSGSTGAAPATSGATSGAAAPATQAAASTLPPGASVGAAGFPTMPFTFEFEGSFFSMQKFLAKLDDFTKVDDGRVNVSGRLLSVDSFELAASRKGFPEVSASISATAYVLPAGEGLTDGATASGPASSGSSSAAITSGDGR